MSRNRVVVVGPITPATRRLVTVLREMPLSAGFRVTHDPDFVEGLPAADEFIPIVVTVDAADVKDATARQTPEEDRPRRAGAPEVGPLDVKAAKAAARKHAGAYTVSYADLRADPDAVVAGLAEHLGVEAWSVVPGPRSAAKGSRRLNVG